MKMMAERNLPVARAPQIDALHATNGSAPLEQAKQPADMQSAIWVERLPVISLRQKPRLAFLASFSASIVHRVPPIR